MIFMICSLTYLYYDHLLHVHTVHKQTHTDTVHCMYGNNNDARRFLWLVLFRHFHSK